MGISSVGKEVGTIMGTVTLNRHSSYFGPNRSKFDFRLNATTDSETPLLSATRKITAQETSFVISSQSGSIVAELTSSNNTLMQSITCAGRVSRRGIWSLKLMSGASGLGHVVYNPKTLGRMCPTPREMFCLVPETLSEAITTASTSTPPINDLSFVDLEEIAPQQPLVHNMLALRNREPQWNEALESYCLEFGERVRVPSKKNFQMIFADEEAPNDILLEHGKMDHTTFSLDFQWPLSPIQAFAFALSQHV